MALIDAKSFLIGAGLSVATTFLLHRISTHSQRRNQETGKAASGSYHAAPPTKTKQIIKDSPDLDLRLIRKAEAVIRNRTSSVTVVVERCVNDHNYSAILRTAEALGIQNVWIIDPPVMTDGAGNRQDDAEAGNNENPKPIKKSQPIRLTSEELEQRHSHRLFAQNATEWLTIREFPTAAECISACRNTSHHLWVTDLSQKAVPLEPADLDHSGNWPLPSRLAIVMGTEAVGCSQEMLDAADLRVYLPLRGFADSLNLSVATALIIHHVFLLNPSYAGQMSEDERIELRKAWFPKLVRQRLLGSRDKKTRKKLLNAISQFESLKQKQDDGQMLTSEQLDKITKLPEHQEKLRTLEEAANYSTSAVDQAVADLVLSPPEPLSDLRRADLHRISFVGRNTKNTHREHWKDMAAVGHGKSESMATAQFFRERVAASVEED